MSTNVWNGFHAALRRSDAAKVPTLLIFLFLLLLLGGCGGMKQMVAPTDREQPPFVQEVPHRIPLSESDLSDDLKLVAGTILMRMYLETDLPREVVFSPRGTHRIHDPSFAYDGFWLENMDVLNYEAEKVGAKIAKVDLSGIFHFRDIINRRTSVSYKASYLVTPSRVTIESSEVRPIQPSFPEVQCFFVPQDAMQRVEPGSLDSFAAWYGFALGNAVAMTPTSEETARRKQYEQMSFLDRMQAGKQSQPAQYAVLVFCMDRIVGNGALMVNLSKSKFHRPQHMPEVVVLEDSGWKIASAGAEIALDSPANQYYVQVFFTPDSAQGSIGPYPVLVGLFATEKNHGQAARSNAQAAAPRQTTTSQGDGAIASGGLALDPRDPAHARIIQTRLAELGYYTSGIDGKFGKGSYAALNAFKRDSGLNDDLIWDMATQKVLFQGTGR